MTETAWKYELDHNARDQDESTFLASRPWRQGRKVPRNVYAQVSDDPSDSDVAIGQFDSEWLAFAAVHGHNAEVVYHPTLNDGSSASPPGSQASQQNTEPSSRRAANASDAEAGLGSTGPGEDPSRAGRAGTPPPTHRDGSGS